MSTPARARLTVYGSMLLLACGGDSGTPPDPDPDPTGQAVTVQVATTGSDLDANGYTVRLGTRSASVDANGTATFDEVAAGTYEVRLGDVATNCLVEDGPARSVTVTSSSGAGTSFTVECSVDFGDGLPTVACTGLSLEAASGLPGDRVGAGSLPTTLEAPVVALMRTPDGSGTGFALFDDDGEGGPGLVVPLHPSASIQGGEVLIRVTDASGACAPISFTVDPLPSADGELGAIVDELLEILESQLELFETTPEELADTPLVEVADPLLPLAIVQRVLDHPDNPESLRAIADGSAPGGYPSSTIDALLARTGLRQALADRGAAPRPTSSSDLASTVGPEDCTPEAVGEDTQRLSDCMNASQQIDARLVALADEVATRVALAIAGAVAADAGQRAAARLALSTVLWTVVQQEARAAATMPNSLGRSLDVVLEPERFDEDDDGTGTWTATVTATSPGWDFNSDDSRTDIVENAGTVLGALGVDAEDLDSGLGEYIERRIEAEIGPDPMVSPETFGPVPVDDPMWTMAEWIGDGGPIEKVDHTTYRPVATGTGLLRLRMPVEDAFGGYAVNRTFPVTVDPIEITIEPSEVFIAPDEQVTFHVTVENSAFPDSITPTVEQGTYSDFMGDAGSYSILYTPPPSPSFDDPDSLHIEHFAVSGARAAGPERSDFAIIQFGKVVIEDQPVCVDTAEEFTFSAEVEGIENQEVTWSATDGTIDEDGVFTAPSERPADGVVTIRATSVVESEIFAEVTVPIGCSCNFSFRLGGETFSPEAGDRLRFSSYENRLTSVSLRRDSQSWTLDMIPPDTAVSDRPDQPGSWPMHVQGDFGLTDPADVTYATEPDALGLLDLEVYAPREKIRGSVSGTAELASTQSPGPIGFDWWFAIEYEAGELVCTVGGG